MLTFMRGFARSKIAVGILFLIVIAFLAGSGGRMFNGGGGDTAGAFVRAGEYSAARPEFSFEFQNIQRQVAQNSPDVKPADLAGNPNVIAEIENRLTRRAALVSYAQQSGMRLPKQAAIDAIKDDPGFKNGLGQLDQQRVAEFAQQYNFPSVETFYDYLRHDVETRYLQVAAVAGLKPPSILSNSIVDALSEQRTIAVALFTAEATPKPPTPTEQELRDYYKTNITKYAVPETRAFSVLQASPMDFIGQVKITDEQVKADYEKRIKDFSSPETRELATVKAPDRAKVQAVVDLVKQGKSLADAVAATPGATVETKKVQPGFTQDKPTDTAVFKFPANEIEGPVQFEGAWVAYMVTSITPGAPMPLSDPLKDQIRRDLAFPEARKMYEQAAEDAVDSLAAGRSLEEISHDLNAPIIALQPIDASARTETGQTDRLLQPYLDKKPLDGQQTLLTAAFQMQPGGLPFSVDADFCPPPAEPDKATCQSRLIMRLDGITPPHTRPFEDVRGEVEMAWKSDKQIEAIKKIADDVIAKVKAGGNFEAAAKAAKLRYEAIPQPIDRLNQQINSEIVEPIMKLNKGDIAALPLGQAGDPRPTLVYVVDAQKLDPKSHPEIANLAQRATTRDLQEDILTALVRAAALKTKPAVNEQAIQAYADTLAGKTELPQ